MRWLCLAALLVATPAVAHEWYAPKCCNERDCAPAVAGDVTPTDEGWYIASRDEVVPYGDSRLMATPAWAAQPYHLCVSQYTSRLLCLYVPGFGS